MTSTNRGGGSADQADDGACWDDLERGLVAYLAMMDDPDGGDCLLVELTDPNPDGGDECPPYAQFATSDEGNLIRAEISGNAYLRAPFRLPAEASDWFRLRGWAGGDDSVGAVFEERNWRIELPADRAGDIVDTVVQALRHHFGIPHPQLLTYQAQGLASVAAELIGLCATEDVPVDGPAPVDGVQESMRGRIAVEPEDRDELLHVVGCVLRAKYGDEPAVDNDGDFVLEHLGQSVWVRVRRDQPAVEILARVAHDVHSRRATAVEVGLLNRDSVWVKWDQRDRTVWQTLHLPGLPFVPLHLDAMLDVFLDAMTSTREDLAYRTGAKVA